MIEPVQAVAAPRWARALAVILFAVMLVAFFKPVPFTFWPITSWELFSRPRAADQASYEVGLRVGGGEEEPLPFSRLGPEHRRWLQIARTLPAHDADGKRAVCGAWADAAAERLGVGDDLEVVVHRVVRRAADDPSDPPTTVERRLVVTCAPTGGG